MGVAMKRIVVAACVVLVAIFTAACARTNEKNAYVVEDAKDGSGVVITGYRGTEKDLVIPATIRGKPVVEIGFHHAVKYVSGTAAISFHERLVSTPKT